MLSLVWERIEVLIAASALALQIASYVREAKARSADRQRIRVAVRERVREVRVGRWIVWRSSVRREDFDRS